MKKLHIIGTGGLAKELIGYIESEAPKRYEIAGCWSEENFNNKQFKEYYSGNITKLKETYQKSELVIIAISNNDIRRRLIEEELKDVDVKYETYIHESCIVSKFASIGKGCIFAPYVIVCADAVIKDFVFLNTEVVIGHDSTVESFCCLFPKVEICGNCYIEESCVFGINSIVLPGLRMKRSSRLDALSVLRKTYNKSAIFLGNPALPVKKI